MTPRPSPPPEERLRMAMEAALARKGADREAFLSWLRAADPELALEVGRRLGEADAGGPDARRPGS